MKCEQRIATISCTHLVSLRDFFKYCFCLNVANAKGAFSVQYLLIFWGCLNLIWGVKKKELCSSSLSSIPNVKIHLVLIRVTVNSQLLNYLDKQIGYQLSALVSWQSPVPNINWNYAARIEIHFASTAGFLGKALNSILRGYPKFFQGPRVLLFSHPPICELNMFWKRSYSEQYYQPQSTNTFGGGIRYRLTFVSKLFCQSSQQGLEHIFRCW